MLFSNHFSWSCFLYLVQISSTYTVFHFCNSNCTLKYLITTDGISFSLWKQTQGKSMEFVN